MGFYIDITACIGCRTCQIACKDKNNLEVGVLYRRVRSFETGVYPNPEYYHYSSSCHHCKKPKCVEVCPTKAMHIAEDNTIQYTKQLCINCQYCIIHCPYGIPQVLGGNGTTGALGAIGKCDSCIDLRQMEENPACVDACVMRCIEWGDLDTLKALHSDEKLTADIAILPSSARVRPALLINAKEAAFDKEYTEQEI